MKLIKPLFTGFIMLSSVLLVSGCSSEVDIIEVAPVPQVENQFSMKQVWSNSTSGNAKIYSLLGPTQFENIIYVAGRNGQVKAIDTTNGKTLWNSDVSESSFFRSQSALLSGGVSVDNKYVYVGSERAVVYALERDTGKLVWQQKVKGEVVASPVASDNKLLVHTTNGFLQALNRDTGVQVWETNLDVPTLALRGQSTPTVAYGAVIIGDDNGHVNAIFLNDGNLIWQQRISQPSGSTEIAKLNDVDSTPVVIDGVVYALGYNGNMVALDLRSGQTIWKRNIGSTHSFVIDSGRIFIVDQEDRLQALSMDGGAVIWKQNDLLHRQLTDPVMYQGYIIVGDAEGYLYWIDALNGEFVHLQKINSSGFLSQPIVANNKLIVQARNGDVYAFER